MFSEGAFHSEAKVGFLSPLSMQHAIRNSSFHLMRSPKLTALGRSYCRRWILYLAVRVAVMPMVRPYMSTSLVTGHFQTKVTAPGA
jgi:hypothetical protein